MKKTLLYLLVLIGILDSCQAPEAVLSTVTGNGQSGRSDGPALNATYDRIKAIATDRAGVLYIADFNNHKAPEAVAYNSLIRRLDASGQVTTLAGSQNGYADGFGGSAAFHAPAGLTVDDVGNVYVADFYNHRLRKITPDGQVTTIAGSGEAGETDGPALTASLNLPNSLVLAPNGDLIFAEEGNRKIRRLTRAGQVITWAGNGRTGTQDGPAAEATFSYISGLAFDRAGNLLIADSGTHRIRQLSPEGRVTTLAGTDSGYRDGPANQAAFNKPRSLIVNSLGQIFVADYGNNRVRMISPNGQVSTVAGNGIFASTDGPVSQAALNNPTSLALDPAGHLLIADYNGNRIRKLTFPAR